MNEIKMYYINSKMNQLLISLEKKQSRTSSSKKPLLLVKNAYFFKNVNGLKRKYNNVGRV